MEVNMKKVLAIILSAALLITALAVNVVAASATGTATGTFSGTFTANDYDSGMSTVTGEEQGKVRIGDEYFDTLVEAVDAAQSGDTITLLNNVEVKRQLELNKANVTLNLGGFTLTASEDFYSTYANDAHLVNVTADGVKITNGTLKTTDKNKHVLNVYYADDIELSGLTLDHTDAGYNGAPMVVNGSNVTVVGKLTTITGTRSWYAINVDNRDDAPASLTFAQNSIMEFAGVKSEGIRMSHTASYPSV